MACLKCGKDATQSGVFCTECLAAMEDYPVKPGTAILLPPSVEDVPERKKTRRQLTVKEEMHRLRRLNRNLAAFALLMTLIAAGLCALLLLT